MPNGGVPINLVLRPRYAPKYVIHIWGRILTIYDKEDFDKNRTETLWPDEEGTKATPILTLDSEETFYVTEFLNYWQKQVREVKDHPSRNYTDIDAQYDY